MHQAAWISDMQNNSTLTACDSTLWSKATHKNINTQQLVKSHTHTGKQTHTQACFISSSSWGHDEVGTQTACWGNGLCTLLLSTSSAPSFHCCGCQPTSPTWGFRLRPISHILRPLWKTAREYSTTSFTKRTWTCAPFPPCCLWSNLR